MLYHFIPQEKTLSASADSFVGRLAIITLGTATPEKQAEAKLRGPKGRTHYIQVVADGDGAAFPQGSTVLVAARRGHLFAVIPAPAHLLAAKTE